jgi:hypothetical protein
MRLSAVLLARVIFFVESVDLNPRGAAYYPDVIRGLVERYQFMNFPQKLEDFDEQKGVTLAVGKLGDQTIEKVVIYNWGLTLETTSSTANAEQLLNQALLWGAANLNLHYNPEMIKRKAYVSHVTFHSDVPLLSPPPIFQRIAKAMDKSIAENLKLAYSFQPYAILLGIDPEDQRIPVQRFSVERRDGIAFAENKYFSAAPVPTDLHLRLLEELERAMGPAHN